MEDAFRNFTDQIPGDIYESTEVASSADIVVFRPREFVVGPVVYLQDYHVALLASDSPPIRVDSRVYQCRGNRLFTFSPDTRLHITEYAPTRPYTAVSIKKDFLNVTAAEAFGKKTTFPTRPENPYSSSLINIIDSFEDELKTFKGKCPLMLECIGMQLVIQILRETGRNLEYQQKKPGIDVNYVNTAIEYMHTFYNANIKIEDICKQIHLSPYYFMRMFKDKTGRSPHEYLLSVRISKAEEMLKRSGYSIGEIARLCGFVNSAHFSNYFRKARGIPPTQYRKEYFI